MNIKQVIASAGRNLHTIIISAREEDGSVEMREAEPYSYRVKGGHELFFCYDINKQGDKVICCYTNNFRSRDTELICATLARGGLALNFHAIGGAL